MSFMFNEKQKNVLDKYSKIWGGWVRTEKRIIEIMMLK